MVDQLFRGGRLSGRLVTAALALLCSLDALAADVTALRFWRAPDNTRIVLDLSGPVKLVQSPDSSPARLVFDIDGAQLKLASDKAAGTDGPVRSIRLGSTGTNGVRLTLDLASEVTSRFFLLPPNEKFGHRLVLDIYDKPSPDRSGAEKVVAEKAAEKPAVPRAPAVTPTLVEKLPAMTDGTAVKPMLPAEDPIARFAETRPVAEKPAQEKPVAEKKLEKPAEKTTQETASKGDAAATSKSVQASDKVSPKGRKIVVAIDAGHGGDDSGAVGPNNVYEKHVTLAIAKLLADRLNDEPGFRAELTRTGDYFIPLKDRRRIARQQHKADIFLSVHADAALNRSAKGASVFALSLKGANTATSRFARALADRENKADLIGGVPLESRDDVLVNVLADMVVEGSLEHSLHMGRNILDEFSEFSALHSRRVEQAGFAVLKEPGMVSLLVETGFISNPEEEKKLSDPAYQKQLAKGILSGLRRYAEQYPMPGTYFAWLSEQRRKGSAQLALNDRAPARKKESATDVKGSADAVHAAKEKPAVEKKVTDKELAARQHRIEKGESLSVIASKYQISMNSLREANRLDDDVVRVGQVLKIPN